MYILVCIVCCVVNSLDNDVVVYILSQFCFRVCLWAYIGGQAGVTFNSDYCFVLMFAHRFVFACSLASSLACLLACLLVSSCVFVFLSLTQLHWFVYTV